MTLTIIAAVLLTTLSDPGPTPAVCRAPASGRVVPSDLIAGRFFGRWPLPVGGEVRFFLDTGGGTTMLYPGAVGRLGLRLDVDLTNGDTLRTARIPQEMGAAIFPAIPGDAPGPLGLYVPPAFLEGQLSATMEEDNGVRVDGMLSRTWFADRIWGFDFPRRQLLNYTAAEVASLPALCWHPLGFQVDSDGQRTSHWPRITVRVAGDSVDLLFDTGASTTVTDHAARATEPESPAKRAASFITRQRLERWRAQHPDWLVVERAEARTGFRMIRVPELEVGGVKVGPVWFTERPDQAFHGFMSEWMDRKVDGALGGSALQSLTLVVDYPGSRIAVMRTMSE